TLTRQVGMLPQILPQLRALDLIQTRQQRLKAAELRHQLFGGLLAHARHTGNVVRAVTHQPQYVDDSFWTNPKTLPYLGHTNALVLHRVQDSDMVRDQLAEVLITGHQDDIVSLCLEPPR